MTHGSTLARFGKNIQPFLAMTSGGMVLAGLHVPNHGHDESTGPIRSLLMKCWIEIGNSGGWVGWMGGWMDGQTNGNTMTDRLSG